MVRVDDLPARLRRDTADLHASVESGTGLPDSIRTRSDYRALLQRMHAFHSAVETRLADPRWAGQWAGVGIDLTLHLRAHLLLDDLAALDTPTVAVAQLDDIESFPTALGYLYVVEGSSLGGRLIGPAIRSTIGAVPTSFFESAGRSHPSPWRSVQKALRAIDDDVCANEVVAGARAAFRAYERHVAVPQTAAVR
ncbi:biliverdin-producing heme oxygenase [Planctomonas psychrotolerans]|uniref:biliverdin-producing heme oxygenase n=1 Tax=Planctomonas psychrotolerans TaxID=2528712 RepID=UPI001D0CFF7D|nr:biliverdin-producing heme oxygenase [Planctomonas psychrotolerans]